MGHTRHFYIDFSIVDRVLFLNIPYTVLLFVIAYLLFIVVPRIVFPQRYAG